MVEFTMKNDGCSVRLLGYLNLILMGAINL
jgi:hypothetical protein